MKSRLKSSRSLTSSNSKEVVETLKKRKTLTSNIIEARQNVDIQVEDVETGNDLRISKGPDVSPEVEKRNSKPQACHFDIAESLPEGLFKLEKPLDHWTIHEVLNQFTFPT